VLVATLGFGAALAAPLFSTVATAATPHTGAIPSATPTPTGGAGGPGGGFAGGAGGFPGGAFRRAFGGGSRGGSRFPGGGGFPRAGGLPTGAGAGAGALPGGAPSFGGGGGFRRAAGAGGAGGGAGFLSSSQSNAALNKALQLDAGQYTWAAATVNSNNAAGYQLGSREPVMAIGGFNGTDPAPTLAQFEKYVSEGKIHYFISSGGGFGGGGFGGGGFGGAATGTADDASQITSWVESHFTAETVGGVTVYNLTTGASS